MKEMHSMMRQAVDMNVVNHVTVSDWSYQRGHPAELADKGPTVHFLSPRSCCEVLLFLSIVLITEVAS